MKRTSFVLVMFSVMSFASVMTAFVFSGILDQVATALNISVAESGLLNTMYAFGAALGPPITLILFRKVERSLMLKILLAITIMMTFALIFARSFAFMLVVRLLMGISANSYGVLATATVVSLAPKGKQGRAVALTIMGGSLALVIGIPLTRLLSASLDWRSIFGILNGIMIFSFVIFAIYLPKEDHAAAKIELRHEFAYLKDGTTSTLILYTLVMFTGYNAFYTYVTPYLLLLFPEAERMMSGLLLMLGIASFIGNLIGGHAADRMGIKKAMMTGAAILLPLSVLLWLVQATLWLTIAIVLLWLACSWFIGLQVNTGIAQATHNQSSFMISVNSSALQLGGAIGSSLSALVIANAGIRQIVFIPMVTCLLIVIIQFISLRKFGAHIHAQAPQTSTEN